MVSKIAVIALVLVVAVPILMGYGLNIETDSHTTYTEDLEKTNVTPLIAQSKEYRYVDADAYSINTQLNLDSYPLYQKKTHAYTGLYTGQAYIRNWAGSAYYTVSQYEYFYLDVYSQHLSVRVTDGGVTTDLNDVEVIAYKVGESDNLLHVIFAGDERTFSSSAAFLTYPGTGYVAGDLYFIELQTSQSTPAAASAAGIFIDLSGGFYVPSYDYSIHHWFAMPAPSSEQLITVDLHAPAHDLIIQTNAHSIYLMSNVDGWSMFTAEAWNQPWEYITDLPFSVYQFLLNKENFTVNYVGGTWPGDIGLANSYRTWGPYPAKGSTADIDTTNIFFRFPQGHVDSNSPIIRIDAAKLRSVTYSVIKNTTYDPSTIITANPSTTIKGIYNTGTSISFGGNTYAASAGNITVGTHQISLQGCKFDSVFNGTGYDNRINGDVVSTSALPSTITFNGTWGIADITSTSMVSTDVTETKWIPGAFAWQGVDTNFKLAGLMASLGIFIGLAIYGRRSGSNVLPLLLICGGAAFVFLLMI